jgi:hypothetical protein
MERSASPSVSSRYVPSYTEAGCITRCDAIVMAIRGGSQQTEVPEAGFGCCDRPLTQLRIFPVPTGALPGLLEQHRPIAILQ